MLLDLLENVIVDDMTPKQVRYVTPVTARNAEERVGEIYKQIRRDFQLVPPLTMFSPSIPLLAGVWSIWRESQFAVGKVDRSVTEAVSSAVSSINACTYCVDAHSGMLHALSEHSVVSALRQNNNDLVQDSKLRSIIEWSLATRDPEAEIVKSPPFTRDEAPEIIGTAVIYHFVNRMANIFLESSPLPVPSGWKGTKKVALRIFGATVAKRIVKRTPKPGESLQFITLSVLPPDLAWAKNSDSIAAAFAGFASTIDKVVEGLLSETARNVIQQRILSWRGEDMGLSKAWLYDALENMAEVDKPAGEIALLTAFSPHQIGADTINRFRSLHPDDVALLNITAWASFSTARRIGAWLGYSERN